MRDGWGYNEYSNGTTFTGFFKEDKKVEPK
jgi:hypothetical protein